jgi:hypothetical protein
MADHPLIRFVDEAAGRRARLVGTWSDVWSVIVTIRDNDGDLAEAAAYLEMEPELIEAAVIYYGEFKDEIDGLIERNERARDEAHASWIRGRVDS